MRLNSDAISEARAKVEKEQSGRLSPYLRRFQAQSVRSSATYWGKVRITAGHNMRFRMSRMDNNGGLFDLIG